MHLFLTRATRADIPEIVDLHYKTITGPLCEVLIGLDTEEGRRKAVQRWLQEMDRSSAHMWFKVLDSDTNRIVSVAHYMVYSNWVPLIPPQVNMDWLPKGEIRDAAEDITRQHVKQRAERLQGQPHIRKYITRQHVICRPSLTTWPSSEQALHRSGLPEARRWSHAGELGLQTCRSSFRSGISDRLVHR